MSEVPVGVGQKLSIVGDYRVFRETLPGEFQVVDIGRHRNNKGHGVGVQDSVTDVEQFRIQTCLFMDKISLCLFRRGLFG